MPTTDEYRMLTGHPVNDVQAKLNTWKHKYKIEILGGPILTSATDDDIMVLVKITPLKK